MTLQPSAQKGDKTMPHTAALSRRALFTLICSLLSVYLVLWCFTGEWPFQD